MIKEQLIKYWESERIAAYDMKEELLHDPCDDTNRCGVWQAKYDLICLFLAQLKELKNE